MKQVLRILVLILLAGIIVNFVALDISSYPRIAMVTVAALLLGFFLQSADSGA